MSRVLVGFDETFVFRGRTRIHAEMDMDFLNVCYTRAPSGQILFYLNYYKLQKLNLRLTGSQGFLAGEAGNTKFYILMVSGIVLFLSR